MRWCPTASPTTRAGSVVRVSELATGTRRAQRLELLLDAALQLYGTDGYARSSVQGVCARAGVRARDFDEHFGGAEDLLEALYDRIVDEVMQAVGAATTAAPLTVEEQTRAGLRAFIATLLADERKARVVLIEVVGVSARLERRRRETLRAFAGVAEGQRRALIAAGQVEDKPLGSWAIMLVGAVNELLVDCMYRSDPPPVDRLVDETTRLWVVASRGA
jgi:AcrR family transcriptional regulator